MPNTLKIRLIVVTNDPQVIAEEEARIKAAFEEYGYDVVIDSGLDAPTHDAIVVVGCEEVVIGDERKGRIFAKIGEKPFWSNDYGEVAVWVVSTLFEELVKSRQIKP